MNTSVLVRVQARGGKFLGPDIGYALVSVRNTATGALLAQGVAAGDSGNLAAGYTPGASFDTVVTFPPAPAPPIEQYLALTPGSTAGFTATFDLDAPAVVEISAAAMTNGIANEHVVSTRIWLWPGANLAQEPGLVLSLPGLNVELITPGPSDKPSGNSLDVSAWVTMMCGCEIGAFPPLSTEGPWEWPPQEFEVRALLFDQNGGCVAMQSLALTATSVFSGTIANLQPGEYQLVVTALQPAGANTGLASRWLTLG
jgi:hypothetical protein